MNDAAQALAGLTVIVTRPRDQGAGLVDAIEARGGRALAMPAIEIEPLPLPAAASPADIVIFISPNAVRHGLAALAQHPNARVLAVGPSTVTHLADAGVNAQAGDGFTSEALLASEALLEGQVSGRRVLIVRGQGGRALLGCKLLQRGAEVDYLEVYHRAIPTQDVTPVLEAWREHGIDLVTATSVQTLENVVSLLGADATALLSGASLVTASERVVKRARALALQHTVMADGPDNDALLGAMLEFARC